MLVGVWRFLACYVRIPRDLGTWSFWKGLRSFDGFVSL